MTTTPERKFWMNGYFQISSSQRGGTLHLALKGDFDGNSACELLNHIEANGGKFKTIHIETDRLSSMHPFGQNLFKKKIFVRNGRAPKLVFTGRYRNDLEIMKPATT
jgi:hypothetical protein